ncbi:MAG TPA: prolipoprotein diacylglyceryl transferase [Actinobacteria bacterium]|nr:prolipoprotein diacylglyceryl transferase [Actinomycetota bacterium]
MAAAFIPSPSRGTWHLGPLPIRAYALCLVGGIILGVWAASRCYRRVGGRPGVILDIATWAVPCGLAGARLYSVITDYQLYFGAGRDWVTIVRIWDGGLGIPGAVAAGSLGAWLACRHAGVSPAPVAGAAAPGLAFGLAAGYWGNWFSQQVYGRPSTMPLAVEISPAHRVPGYENYATFQPTFLYECGWDLLVGVLVIWAARRFLPAGDRAFAGCLAGLAVGRYFTESLRIDPAYHLLGLRVSQWVMALVFTGAAGYLYLTRGKRAPDHTGGAAAGSGTLRPTSAAVPLAPGDCPPAQFFHVPGVSAPGMSGQICTGSAQSACNL